jgi:hypothetical protein
VTLDDFGPGEAITLNERYGSVLGSPTEVSRLMALVGGHPYLLQCAFDELKGGATLERLEADARREAGSLGEHLRRLRALLQNEPVLERAMNAVLREGTCPDRDSFYRLRSAGLIQGASASDARPRCGLYRQLTSGSS